MINYRYPKYLSCRWNAAKLKSSEKVYWLKLAIAKMEQALSYASKHDLEFFIRDDEWDIDGVGRPFYIQTLDVFWDVDMQDDADHDAWMSAPVIVFVPSEVAMITGLTGDCDIYITSEWDSLIALAREYLLNEYEVEYDERSSSDFFVKECGAKIAPAKVWQPL